VGLVRRDAVEAFPHLRVLNWGVNSIKAQTRNWTRLFPNRKGIEPYSTLLLFKVSLVVYRVHFLDRKFGFKDKMGRRNGIGWRGRFGSISSLESNGTGIVSLPNCISVVVPDGVQAQ